MAITKRLVYKDENGTVHEYSIGCNAENITQDTTHRFVTDTEKSAWNNKAANTAFTGATANAAGKAGMVPAPTAGSQAKYLRADGTWQAPPDTNTTYSAATTSAHGLMSASDKKKLDGIATGANAYTLPTASSTTLGGVKTTSTVSSNSGYTACPIIGGVPYYKDTNTTYSAATTSANGLMSAADKKKLDAMYSSNDFQVGNAIQLDATDGYPRIQMVSPGRGCVFGDYDIPSSMLGYPIIGSVSIAPGYWDDGVLEYVTVGEIPEHWWYCYNSNGKQEQFAYLGNNGIIMNMGSFSSNGADYAEYWEWEDGNVAGEDRIGLFVTFAGNKIRISGKEDRLCKVAITSGAPVVIGDDDGGEWKYKYAKDIYGRPLYEEVLNKKGELCKNRIVNPAYDETLEYRKRSERQEWIAVGTHGKLVVRDDGSCKADSFCVPTDGGIATASEEENGFYVMERLDESHIRIYIR